MTLKKQSRDLYAGVEKGCVWSKYKRSCRKGGGNGKLPSCCNMAGAGATAHDKICTIDRTIIFPGKGNYNMKTETEAAPAASLCLEGGLYIMAENKGKRLPQGISLRKDGRYQARYTLNGKRYTIYGKDLKEVQRKLRDAKYEIDHGIFAKPEKITVDTWFETWLKEY